jgi:2-polyprenyl-3-methyl-5-hydroxy-6-metoxy-1,4-benzoquinol methylase
MANKLNHSAYSEMYEIQANHWWYVGRRLILEKILSEFLPTKKERILEIGAGSGGNILLLSRFGEVEVTDIEEKGLVFCKQIAEENKITINSIHGDFCEKYSQIPKKSFSTICMFDVIEHIKEEKKTLDLCSELLDQKGKIFITVPAYQWLWSAHDDYFHHERRYTKITLQRVLKESGFEIQDSGYFNSILFPLALLQRLFEKVIGSSNGKVVMPNKLVNQILLGIFSTEAYMYRTFRIGFGLSIWLVAEKKLPSSHEGN